MLPKHIHGNTVTNNSVTTAEDGGIHKLYLVWNYDVGTGDNSSTRKNVLVGREESRWSWDGTIIKSSSHTHEVTSNVAITNASVGMGMNISQNITP